MDAELASNSPQKRDSEGLGANKYLIFFDMDAADFKNWRTNLSFFSDLFAGLTSGGVRQFGTSEQLTRPWLFCSPGLPPRSCIALRQP